jgi:dTDP-4-dehydrorhamnose reductase
MILLTGGTGFLGQYLRAELAARGVAFRTLGRSGNDLTCDLADHPRLRDLVLGLRPTHVLNAGAFAQIAGCEAEPARALAVNADALTGLLSAPGTRLLQVSTDLVFDGTAAPYGEDAAPRPLSAYGASKARGESIARSHPDTLVVRVPLLFGRSCDGARGATDMVRAALAAARPLALYTNEARTPLHARDAAGALVELLLSRRTGVVHLPGPERITRADLARRLAARHGLDLAGVAFVPSEDPRRPRDVALGGGWQAPRGLDAMLDDS